MPQLMRRDAACRGPRRTWVSREKTVSCRQKGTLKRFFFKLTCNRADTAVVGSHSTLVFIWVDRSCTALGIYSSNNPDSWVFTSSLYPEPVTQLAMRECHCCPSTVETYKMPARLTVAGVAYFRSRISKIIRMLARSGMRSFEARVST